MNDGWRKMLIEIFNKKTGEIIEEQEVKSIKSFLYYWSVQYDSVNFGWRKKK